MKIGNVKASWSAPWSLTVMGLDSAAMMNVANNPREMWERTAQQTMSALVLFYVASIMSAEIHVLDQVIAVNYRVIVRRVREIVTMIQRVKALWSVAATAVLGPDLITMMTVAYNPRQMRARTA